MAQKTIPIVNFDLTTDVLKKFLRFDILYKGKPLSLIRVTKESWLDHSNIRESFVEELKQYSFAKPQIRCQGGGYIAYRKGKNTLLVHSESNLFQMEHNREHTVAILQSKFKSLIVSSN